MWAEYPEVEKELEVVEKYIRDNIRSRNKLLNSIVTELVDAGGKRLRPAFVIIASKFGKYNPKKSIPMAGAFEILHTATLVHDDIIDHAKYRRSKKTVSHRYGSDIAIYTGDFLFTKAVLMLSRDIPTDQMEIVARAIKVICEGEVDQYQDRYNVNSSVMSYLKRINRKTAVLFSTACAVGAYLSKCPAKVVRNLARFGFCYGMAFQIKDDLKDFLSDEKSEGKPVGHDILKGIFTLPAIYAINKNSEVRAFIKRLTDKKENIEDTELIELYGLIRKEDGIRYTGEILDRYITRGMTALDNIPDNRYKKILRELLNELAL
ncbi:MAG: polyprenyl synthetase family protein [Clostridia bacterium]|nr:polyprenyl synthetase family protein [Clostridia bacterium]